MRHAWLSCVFLCCGVLAQASPPVVCWGKHVLVPARWSAEQTGVIFAAGPPDTWTFTGADNALRVQRNRKAAQRTNLRTDATDTVSSFAPALILRDTLYVDVAALDEVVGGVVFRLDRPTAKRGTLTVPGRPPIPLDVIPFPTSPLAKDDTLAGLAIGGHIATAVARWGDPLDVSDDSIIPGTRQYRFPVDPAGGIELLVFTRGDAITVLHVSLTGASTLKQMRPYLAQTGTAGGARLASEMPRAYGKARADYAHYSDDVLICNYRRGGLVLITLDTFAFGTVTITELTLARRGFPGKDLPMGGPLN